MSNETTIDAVRLALRMHELQAQVASLNIANANRPGAQAQRIDFSAVQAELLNIASGDAGRPTAAADLARAQTALRSTRPVATNAPINADAQVGDMVLASTQYQTLSEALGRQFALMRLAISGRSGA